MQQSRIESGPQIIEVHVNLAVHRHRLTGVIHKHDFVAEHDKITVQAFGIRLRQRQIVERDRIDRGRCMAEADEEHRGFFRNGFKFVDLIQSEVAVIHRIGQIGRFDLELDQAGVESFAEQVGIRFHHHRLEGIPVAVGELERAERRAAQIGQVQLGAVEQQVHGDVTGRLGGQPNLDHVFFAQVVSVAAFNESGDGIPVPNDVVQILDTLSLVEDQSGLVVVIDLNLDARNRQSVVALDTIDTLTGDRIGPPRTVEDQRLRLIPWEVTQNQTLLTGARPAYDFQNGARQTLAGRREVGRTVGEGRTLVVRIVGRRQAHRRFVKRGHLPYQGVINRDEVFAGIVRRGGFTESAVIGEFPIRAQIAHTHDKPALAGTRAIGDENLASQQIIRIDSQIADRSRKGFIIHGGQGS